MAGYGTLMDTCSKLPFQIGTVNVECNPPSYLWQVLICPQHRQLLIKLCDELLASEMQWPKCNEKVQISSDWFPAASLTLIEGILFHVKNLLGRFSPNVRIDKNEIALAIILPFAGRLSSCVQGNVVTHVKKGGMVIFNNWETDFKTYLYAIKKKIGRSDELKVKDKHKVILGDIRDIKLDQSFSSMITSPPYPNSRSYSSMFHPENAILRYLEERNLAKGYSLHKRLIGSPCVSEFQGEGKKGISDVSSATARKFLSGIEEFKGSKQSEYDNRVYYLPYFSQYFAGIESAYKNISKYLTDDFIGYIVVVNNTHRKQIVPVAQSVIEIWKKLGYRANVVPEYTRELSHMGGINPRVKGLTARHTEYTIKVTRK
jgi:hypothetical protein